MGVNKDTIHNWETNRTEPEVRMIPHIIDFLGYAPYNPNWPFGERLRAVRSALGLSQEQLARRAELDESTVAKWEREEHRRSKGKWAASVASILEKTNRYKRIYETLHSERS
jgi:transcriptional regulator with XRE-family HTH domain